MTVCGRKRAWKPKDAHLSPKNANFAPYNKTVLCWLIILDSKKISSVSKPNVFFSLHFWALHPACLVFTHQWGNLGQRGNRVIAQGHFTRLQCFRSSLWSTKQKTTAALHKKIPLIKKTCVYWVKPSTTCFNNKVDHQCCTTVISPAAAAFSQRQLRD